MDYNLPEISKELRKLDDLLEFIEDFIDSMVEKPNIENLTKNSSVLYVGDLHGYYKCLSDVLNLAEKLNPDYIVFLGDYIDRGTKQLETILDVMELSIRNNHFIPLRGNHEIAKICQRDGFYDSIKKRFNNPKTTDEVFNHFIKSFEYFPLASITEETRTLAIHGGIPETMDLAYLKKITKPHSSITYVKNTDEAEMLEKTLFQLLWNDPNTNVNKNNEEIDFLPSKRGKNPKMFNEVALNKFLETNNISRVIRAHEASRGAFENVWGKGKLIHIFTASPYYHENDRVPMGNIAFEENNNDKSTIKIYSLDGKLNTTI